MRPRLLVTVTGTGTEIGKTWLSVQAINGLRSESLRVAARKPAQSFEPTVDITDADLLGNATGEPASKVCPEHRWYPVAMAPPMAAAKLGMRPPLIGELIDEVAAGWPLPGVDVGIVEGAGGVASPLAIDGDSSDLAKGLGSDMVVLVADAGLGTINAVRLGARAVEPLPVVVFLNRFDSSQELHRRNRDWLSQVDGLQLCCHRDDLVLRILEPLRA
ncbi:MAG TPA: dethiobiotin synthase [Acidimicrobiales bacterium]|nr:dethiobiotin synthase [Acidimicrobiales bacterium]